MTRRTTFIWETVPIGEDCLLDSSSFARQPPSCLPWAKDCLFNSPSCPGRWTEWIGFTFRQILISYSVGQTGQITGRKDFRKSPKRSVIPLKIWLPLDCKSSEKRFSKISQKILHSTKNLTIVRLLNGRRRCRGSSDGFRWREAIGLSTSQAPPNLPLSRIQVKWLKSCLEITVRCDIIFKKSIWQTLRTNNLIYFSEHEVSI